MPEVNIPPYSYSDLRETPITAADAWTAVDDRVDATGLANVKPNGKRLMALTIVASVDGAAVGASNIAVRITGIGVGVQYFVLPLAGGTLATTNLAAGNESTYVFATGLSTADELVIEAAMVGADCGTAYVAIALYFA